MPGRHASTGVLSIRTDSLQYLEPYHMLYLSPKIEPYHYSEYISGFQLYHPAVFSPTVS